MDAITNWFKNSKEYYSGVAIYASLPTKKIRTLKLLNKGKSRKNMATLVSELRQYKNAPTKKETPKLIIELPKVVPTQETINVEVQRRQTLNESSKREFGGVMIGDLPAELRPRYSRARTVFEEMIELKFALNDLPAKAEESALKIIMKIEQLDDERDLIWKELHHWKNHKTILPSQTDDFTGLTERELDLKARNLKSNISKINSRVNALYEKLDNETDKHQQHLLENKINASEKRMHQHQINLTKIEKLL